MIQKSPVEAKTPELVLMDWIDKNDIQLHGATPAMLVSVLSSAGFVRDNPPASSAPIELKLDSAAGVEPAGPKVSRDIDSAMLRHGYTLEPVEDRKHIGEWAPDEAEAYRDNGGFQDGMSAVHALRRSKIAAAVESTVAHAQANVLRAAADKLNARSMQLLETSVEMSDLEGCTVDDVIRYGAYAAEASVTANELRGQADQLIRSR